MRRGPSRTAAPVSQIISAFVLAPTAAAITTAIVFALWMQVRGQDGLLAAFYALLFGLGWGFPMALVLGVPVYLLLRRRLELTAMRAIIVGALVAVAPYPLLMMLNPGSFHGLENLAMNGAAAAGIMLLGAVGGTAFWAVATRGGVLTDGR